MKRRALIKRLVIVILVLALAVMTSIVAPTQQAAAKATTLKAISFIPVQAAICHFLGVYADRVKERSKGELEIKWLGGPEVIPTPALAEAVMKGRVDIALDVGNLFSDKLPSAFGMAFSEYTAMEEREKGVYEWIAKQFKKVNIHYLVRVKTDMPMYLFTNFPVKTPEDFAGHPIGALDFGMGFTRALGASPVNVPKRDWYISVDRGVVDGYCLPAGNMVNYKLHEVTKYIIDHGFNLNHEALFMNLKKWNSLPKHLQKLMTEVAVEMEPDVRDFFIKDTKRARKLMKDAGIKFIKFSPADAKRYLDVIYNTLWQEYKAVAGPEIFAETKKIMLK